VPAAHRDEESVSKTARVDVSLPFCKTRIERGKGVEGGSSITQVAVKTGIYETARGGPGQVSKRVELTATPRARYREEAAD
jgi:hypothetical protein